MICFKDSHSQCFEDCEDCPAYRPRCCMCEASRNVDMYCVDGELYCANCLIEKYSKRDGENLFDEFIDYYSEEYEQFILEQFDYCKEDGGDE